METKDFVCGKEKGSENGCGRKALCVLCDGDKSGSYVHPFERFVNRAGRGTWLGKAIVLWLFGTIYNAAQILLDSMYFGGIQNVPSRLVYKYLLETVFVAGYLLLWMWILRELKLSYGKIEKNIPDEYKFHTDSSFNYMFSPLFFVFSLIFMASLQTVVSLGGDGKWHGWTVGGIIIGDLIGANLVVLFFDGFYAQLFLGFLIFSPSLVLPRYKDKSSENILELKDGVRTIFNRINITVILLCTLSGVGTLVPYYLGTAVENPFEFNIIQNLMFPLILLMVGLIFTSILHYWVTGAIDKWAKSKERHPEYMVLEFLPTGNGSSVHIETTRPRREATIEVKNTSSIENVKKDVNTLVTIASALTSRGEQPEGESTAVDNSMLIQEKFRNLGENLGQEYLKDEILRYFDSSMNNQKGMTVIIRATGEEATLPWELLNHDGDFLSLKANVVRTRRALDLVRERQINILNVLIVANDARTTKLPRVAYLDQIGREVGTLERILGGSVGTKVILNKDATRENVMKNLRTGGFQALHFSGHSFFNPQKPGYSHLLLYNDETLSAYDLRSLVKDNPGLQLIFLNSCHSGLETHMGRHALNGLADAFVTKGIPYVIGMQWEVTDKGSAEFSKLFYRSLSKNMSPEQAVRKARKTLAYKYNFQDPIWAAPILYRA
jgi:CHAT domain-containing protein